MPIGARQGIKTGMSDRSISTLGSEYGVREYGNDGTPMDTGPMRGFSHNLVDRGSSYNPRESS